MDFKEIRPEDVNWKEIGTRLVRYREFLGLDREEFSNRIGITESKLSSYELGKERKSLNVILEICQKIKLNLSWLVSGKGFPFQSSNNVNLIDPMKIGKGAGIRLSKLRRDSEDGIMDEELTEFVMTMDDFKRKNGKSFLSLSDIYQVTLYLGYRKIAPKASHIECIDQF